jgi:hypothetical protein
MLRATAVDFAAVKKIDPSRISWAESKMAATEAAIRLF